MAQMGSYAMITCPISAGANSDSAICNWMRTKSSAPPTSRTADGSPTQISGLRPFATAAAALSATVRSVSPKCSLRSEWPISIKVAPASFAILMEISPVHDPSAAQ
jgi:hypothetical protein